MGLQRQVHEHDNLPELSEENSNIRCSSRGAVMNNYREIQDQWYDPMIQARYPHLFNFILLKVKEGMEKGEVISK